MGEKAGMGVRLVVFGPLAEQEKESLKRDHPFCSDIVEAISIDLSRDPLTRATLLEKDRYFQIYSPRVDPPIAIRVGYILNDEKVMIKIFNWYPQQ